MSDVVPGTGLTTADIKRGWHEESRRVTRAFDGQADIVFSLCAEVESLRAALLNIKAVQRWRDIPIDTVNCSNAIMDCREMYDIADAALGRWK